MSAFYLRVGAVVLIVLALAGALYLAYDHGVSAADSRWQAKWADQLVLQAKGLAAATTENRNEEQRRQAAVNEAGSNARTKNTAAAADAVAADAAGQRLHDSARELAATASCSSGNSAVTERSAAATRAAMVLSDLFQRADKRAGELAKAYDAARIAGLACEAAYDSLTKKKERPVRH
jgi:hypothetical protein